MDLTKIIPRESILKLESIDKEFALRPINLSDEIWLKHEYGDERIQEIFENVEVDPISRIVFRLIKNEDKSFFKKRDVEFITEDGESETYELGGLKLFQFMIQGWGDKIALINALLDNIGVSRPDVKEEENKKKAKRPKKK